MLFEQLHFTWGHPKVFFFWGIMEIGASWKLGHHGNWGIMEFALEKQ